MVACKDFSQDFFFIPFKEVGESSIDDEKFKYKYRYFDIEQLINKNHKIIDHEAAISSFWKMYVIDALLANSDRHGSNWGFLKNKHQYLMAPVFDNGSCLFSNFSSVDEMNEVLADASLFNEYIFDRPKSLILEDNTITEYDRIIASKKYKECNKAIIDIVPMIDLKEINIIIEKTDLTSTQKTSIKKIIEARYNCILLPVYEELTHENH